MNAFVFWSKWKSYDVEVIFVIANDTVEVELRNKDGVSLYGFHILPDDVDGVRAVLSAQFGDGEIG